MNRFVVSFVLLVYVLSAGPVEWLHRHGLVDTETVRTVFAPLLWLIDAHLMPQWLAAWILWWMPQQRRLCFGSQNRTNPMSGRSRGGTVRRCCRGLIRPSPLAPLEPQADSHHAGPVLWGSESSMWSRRRHHVADPVKSPQLGNPGSIWGHLLRCREGIMSHSRCGHWKGSGPIPGTAQEARGTLE
jgi:hypothetical protein